MTGTDGSTGSGGSAGGWNRPAWPSLSGGGDGTPTPAAPGAPAAPGVPERVSTETGPIPTRRQLRTGAIPVVPPAAPAPGPSTPTAAPAPVPAERRSTWTHPNLVGRDAATPDGAAPQPGPVAAVPAAPAAQPPTAAQPPIPTTGDDGGSGDGDDPDALGTPDRRRRWPLVVGIVAAVLVVGGAGTAYVLTRDDAGPAAAPPDVVLPSPTASVEPVARPATTAFASALPATVLQYALTASADDAEWLAQGAVEAYTETYGDGGDAEVTVRAGQWATPEEADAVLAGLVAGLPAVPEPTASPSAAASASATAEAGPRVLSTGEVLVDGAATGTVTVLDAGDGSGVAVWRNGTTVFHVVGPAADIANLYAAYPL